MKIDDLYFGVKLYDPNANAFKTWNIFNSSRVRWDCASYVKYAKEEGVIDPLRYCFGSLWGRVQYEFMVAPVFTDDVNKVDIYQMYIEPNRDYLMSLVDSISLRSATQVLQEDKKRRKALREVLSKEDSKA